MEKIYLPLTDKSELSYNSVKIKSTENDSTGEILQSTELINIFIRINDAIKYEISLDKLISTLINETKSIFDFEKVAFLLIVNDQIVEVYKRGFAKSPFDFIIDSGLLKLALEEKRNLLIPNAKIDSENEFERLLIVPIIFSTDSKVVFCFDINNNFNEEFRKNYYGFLEILLSFIGQKVYNHFIMLENKKLSEILTTQEHYMGVEENYSTIGKVCLKSFHELKNRTQVVVSAINLLQKNISNNDYSNNERIFTILNSEIPQLTLLIKKISEFSNNLFSDTRPVYFELRKFLEDLMELINLSGISRHIKIFLPDEISNSKIFGYYDKLNKALMLLIIEFLKHHIDEVSLRISENTSRLNIHLIIDLTDNFNSINLLDEQSNINFVRIKKILNKNSCSLFTKLAQERYELIISMPKRASQFKMKEVNYDKDSRS